MDTHAGPLCVCARTHTGARDTVALSHTHAHTHTHTQVHETLVALSPWAVVRMGDDEWCVDLPRGRRLSLAISPLGAITDAGFQGN